MTRSRFLFAIANHIFQYTFEQPACRCSFKAVLQSFHCLRWKQTQQVLLIGQASLVAMALLSLGSQSALADASILSFDLDGGVRRYKHVSSQFSQSQRPASTTEDSGSSISLQLPQFAFVASAPLAISRSIEQLSQDTLDPSTPAIEPPKPIQNSPISKSKNKSAPKIQTSASSQVSSFEMPEAWWNQGAESPIAVAIGSAEGTRRADGSKTMAYYWHLDPGNGADNFGTFSYQHFPPSMTTTVQRQATTLGKREAAAQAQLPEMADHEQMKRLRRFYDELRAQAATHNLQLNQLEIMNGLDLANQSEAAALSVEGYIDRLAQMKGLEEEVEEQIVEARSWSYWDPDRRSWNAPGLGNHYDNVRRDQERRYEAIRQAMATYAPSETTSNREISSATTNRAGSPGRLSQSPAINPAAVNQAAATSTAVFGEAIANRIIDFNLPS